MAVQVPERERAPLSPGMTTFIVVDVILVLTFLALLALLGTGGSQVPTPVASASTTDGPETTPDSSAPTAPTDAETLTSFVLPSGNIWCSMTETTAACTILQYTFTPPAVPEGCDGTVGNVLQVTAGEEAALACVVGEPQRAPAGTITLEYGQASTVGEMTCHSSTNGATCRHNPSGAGFSVARGGYTLF
ncbi:hypothetical protein [Actinotalea sp.]|uniref:hypothetical protein n=1 Tax=Actinotalea sp. TaxID=1872145 RepID=UPI00356B303A